MKVLPENLTADKEIAQLLACWDYTTPITDRKWQGAVSPNARSLFDNTPVEAMATAPSTGIGGAVLRPDITNFWMASSFYQMYDSISFVMQLANYTTPTPLMGGTFIVLDTVAVQPIKAGDSKYYDYLGMTYLSGGPNYPMPPGGPKYLSIVNQWNIMDKNDWVAISICFTPPIPIPEDHKPEHGRVGPYILIGDSANHMLDCDLYPNPSNPDPGWTQKISDIKNGSLSVDAVKMLLAYGPTDVYVKKMGIYGGMVNATGLQELKSAMEMP